MTQVARSPRPEPVLTPSDSPEYVATARMTWDEWLDWDYEGGLTEWLDKDRAGREPDIMFIATEHLDRKQSRFMEGAPDIIVEVISEDSVRRDRTIKLLEYQALGVPEYWLIDSRPGEQSAEFYVLTDGRYLPVEPVDGVFHSTVLAGFWLRTDWLWEDEPKALAAFREITAS
ncbi:MAG: Uma2 family endonuclease [Chloroflexi bacterium]|nr:Uma2 family endonuclease [Chloroflexota bacterium]